jgi:hypothetical protein
VEGCRSAAMCVGGAAFLVQWRGEIQDRRRRRRRRRSRSEASRSLRLPYRREIGRISKRR